MIKKHPKIFFILRFLLWTILTIGVPTFIILEQYSFFKEYQSFTLKISGWGTIVLILGSLFTFYILKTLADAINNPVLKQTLNGIIKITLPLSIIFLLTGIIVNNIDKIRIILWVSLISTGIGIPINPLPQYLYNQKKKRGEIKCGKLKKLVKLHVY
jgi:hypothetical protein